MRSRLTTPELIVASARSMLGTPFRHQGRVPGVGLDCVGLVIAVARELDLSGYDVTGYSRLPQPALLRHHLACAGLVEHPPSAARPGDVMLMRLRRLAQHLAIRTDIGMIHSHIGSGGVVEHRLAPNWQERLLSVFRFPDL